MKTRTTLLLICVIVFAGLGAKCKKAAPCFPFGYCPVGSNPQFNLVVDIVFCDGRHRTYRLGYNGCTYSIVADPNKGESCSFCANPVVRRLPFFGFLPFGSVYLPSPPSSFHFNLGPGEDLYLDSTYGTPIVEYRDEDGVVVGNGTVTAVASDGTWLDASPPDLSQAYTGSYTVEISNVDWTGERHIVGTAQMDAYGRDRPDSDGDGVYDDEDCFPFDPSQWSCGGGGGGGGGDDGGCLDICNMY